MRKRVRPPREGCQASPAAKLAAARGNQPPPGSVLAITFPRVNEQDSLIPSASQWRAGRDANRPACSEGTDYC